MSTLSDIFSTLAAGDSISENKITVDGSMFSKSKPFLTGGGVFI